MKKFILFLLLVACLFTGGVFLARWLPLALSKPLSVEPVSVFQPAPYPLLNRPMTVVIIGKNNGAFAEKTLASVFSQTYENYRIIYIDDASSDGSFELVRDLVYESAYLPKVTLVHNEESLGFLANLFRAVESCADEEIIAVLNGEDWLAHEWVLQRINQYYADPDLWLTYGQYCEYPSFERGSCCSCEKDFRSSPFVASHLQTFYAGLFKKIKTSDFLYGGGYFPAAEELAYMIPMLEMAQDHSSYIPEVLYVVNQKSMKKEDHELHAHCEKAIRELAAYSPVQILSFEKEIE